MGTIEGRTEASNSSIARPAGCRVGRAGPGVRGWRNGVGYGRLGCGYGRYGYGRWGYRRYGCGAAALTGAALGYLAVNYGYGYEEPYGYGNTSLYSYAPTNYAVSTPAPAAPTGSGYALVQFTGGHYEVWSNGYPSGGGWTMLVEGQPGSDAVRPHTTLRERKVLARVSQLTDHKGSKSTPSQQGSYGQTAANGRAAARRVKAVIFDLGSNARPSSFSQSRVRGGCHPISWTVQL